MRARGKWVEKKIAQKEQFVHYAENFVVSCFFLHYFNQQQAFFFYSKTSTYENLKIFVNTTSTQNGNYSPLAVQELRPKISSHLFLVYFEGGVSYMLTHTSTQILSCLTNCTQSNNKSL